MIHWVGECPEKGKNDTQNSHEHIVTCVTCLYRMKKTCEDVKITSLIPGIEKRITDLTFKKDFKDIING